MPDAVIPKHLSNGRALWGNHALWVNVLSSWLKAHAAQGGRPNYLNGVEFDKLAHFVQLIWLRLAAKEKVSFGFVYRVADGIHGPGPALTRHDRRDRHMHLLDVLDTIQSSFGKNPDIHLFDLKKRKYEGAVLYDVRPGHDRTYQPLHLSHLLPPAFQGDDLDYVRQIERLVEQLDADELRAVGTHQNEMQTLRAIEYNVYIQLYYRFVIEARRISGAWQRIRVPDSAAEGRPTRRKSDLVPLRHVITEVYRKSGLNKKDYSAAYAKIVAAAARGDEVARMTVDEVLADPEQIWTPSVEKWSEVGDQMSDVHSYLRALRAVRIACRARSVRPGAHQEATFDEKLATTIGEGIDSVKRLEASSPARFPPVQDATSDGGYWSEVLAGITDVFRSLPAHTDYRAVFEKRARRVNMRGGI